MSLLTPQLLRDAADKLSVTFDDSRPGQENFMCYAVRAAAQKGMRVQVRARFSQMLDHHDVSTGGSLSHKGVRYADAHNIAQERRAQTIRFDFLNLLACEMETA